MRRGLFTLEFEPVVQIGDIVKLIPKPEPEIEFWEIVWIEAVPEVIKDFGSISASTEKELTKVTELELNKREFGQWRIELLDDIEITEIRYGGKTVTPMWSLKSGLGKLSARAMNLMTEFFTWEDKEIWFKVKNPTKYSISTSRVLFRGYVFQVKPYMAKPPAYTRIPLGSRKVRGVPA